MPAADKVAHAALYAILGSSLAWANHRGGRGSSHTADALVLTVGAVYGASDEWHQSFTPGRDASSADFAADVVGLAVGYVLTQRLLRGRRDRTPDSGSAA